MKKTIVLATIPSDSHTWNLIYLEMFLVDNGFEVINMGACTELKNIRKTCLKIIPAAVVVSTLNGHGYLEGNEVANCLKEVKRRFSFKMIIGGKLMPGVKLDKKSYDQLRSAGYDAVFDNPDNMADFELFMRQIVENKFLYKGEEEYRLLNHVRKVS